MIASIYSQVDIFSCRVLWQCSPIEVRVSNDGADEDETCFHEETQTYEEDVGRGGLQWLVQE